MLSLHMQWCVFSVVGGMFTLTPSVEWIHFVVWQALEDIFKTQLNNINSNTHSITTPELNTVK